MLVGNRSWAMALRSGVDLRTLQKRMGPCGPEDDDGVPALHRAGDASDG